MKLKVIEIIGDLIDTEGDIENINSGSDAWASIAHLNLILALEEEFGVEIPPEDFPKLHSDICLFKNTGSCRVRNFGLMRILMGRKELEELFLSGDLSPLQAGIEAYLSRSSGGRDYHYVSKKICRLEHTPKKSGACWEELTEKEAVFPNWIEKI